MPATTDSFKAAIGDKVVEVDPSDFDRFEWRALKQLLAMSQMELLAALGELDLDAIAGMVWLVLRRDDPDIVLDDVNLRLADLYDTPEEADASPPDPAGAA